MLSKIKKLRVKIEFELFTEEWNELIDACRNCEQMYKVPKLPGYEKRKIRKARLKKLKHLRIVRAKIEKAFYVADVTMKVDP